jgi:hypothetical protein
MESTKNLKGYLWRRWPWAAVMLPLFVGCNRQLSTNDGGAGLAPPWIQLLVPAAARRPGAVMPVQVDVALPNADGGQLSVACVAIGGEPGTLRPAFPGSCPATDGGAQPDPSDGGATDLSQICLGLTHLDAVGSASTLALYTPRGQESVITLVGGVYANSACTGAPAATVAVIVDLAAPPGSSDAGSGHPATDAHADGNDAPSGKADDAAASSGDACAGSQDGSTASSDAGVSTCPG